MSNGIYKTFNSHWQVPFGELALKLDPLSLIFLTAIAILVICAGVYGIGYMRHYVGKKPLWLHVFFYLLLTLGLILIVTANNVILFLGAWEAMSMATYFLIVFHDEKASVRKAGLLYLIAAHCGTFLLFLMFFLMSHAAGSMNFDVISRTSFSSNTSGMIFLLAIVGFGVKAGFLPLHIWLPHAHPAAPSHVSALLSGVGIKTGIYGICRVIWMISGLPDWCGYLLFAIGVVSGVMGVLYALGQHELKKLLAYHSIENIGIIALGLGLGLVGRSSQMPFLSAVGFAGGLLHVLNHSIFKGLLFLDAGAVIQKTNTGEMDHLGGIAKSMPMTSILFLIGALSICGLPLFNGFISEFMIYFGLFHGLLSLPLNGVVVCALGILALALMGALALACFAKVYGTVFSGEPRDPSRAAEIHDPSAFMVVPMSILAGLCLWIGLAPDTIAEFAFQAGSYLAYTSKNGLDWDKVMMPLSVIVALSLLFLALVVALLILRRRLSGTEPMPLRDTWGCGYAEYSARCQYTSSSFARPITDFVRKALLFNRHGGQVTGYLPARSHLTSSVHDASEELAFRPFFVLLTGLSKKLDDGRIRYTQMYLMYIFLFLIFLLAWKLG